MVGQHLAKQLGTTNNWSVQSILGQTFTHWRPLLLLSLWHEIAFIPLWRGLTIRPSAEIVEDTCVASTNHPAIHHRW